MQWKTERQMWTLYISLEVQRVLGTWAWVICQGSCHSSGDKSPQWTPTPTPKLRLLRWFTLLKSRLSSCQMPASLEAGDSGCGLCVCVCKKEAKVYSYKFETTKGTTKETGNVYLPWFWQNKIKKTTWQNSVRDGHAFGCLNGKFSTLCSLPVLYLNKFTYSSGNRTVPSSSLV